MGGNGVGVVVVTGFAGAEPNERQEVGEARGGGGAVLKLLLREIRIALLGYRPGDAVSCETCGRKLDPAYWANGFPFCDSDCSERHHSYLL